MMTVDPVDYELLKFELQEADEAFQKLREDYHALRTYADELESRLSDHGIEYPDFCGW